MSMIISLIYLATPIIYLQQSHRVIPLLAEYSTPGSQLFIAPESLQLHRNGYITFAMGIPHPPSSKYMAPEVSSKSSLDSSDQQKVLIYLLLARLKFHVQ